MRWSAAICEPRDIIVVRQSFILVRMSKAEKIFIFGSAIGAFVGAIVVVKDQIGGGKYKGKEKLLGKTVVITGANTGIGLETAKDLAARGARIILACRDAQKCEDAVEEIRKHSLNKNLACYDLDLASFRSIRKFAKEFKTNEKRLDILINNAGIMRCKKSITEDGLEMQLGVNHFGHFLLTNLLLEELKASAPSRIVVLSSVAHSRGEINFDDLNSEKKYNPGTSYNQSKLANILFIRELAERLTGSGVTVNSVHPGVVNTELMRHMSFYKSYISSLLVYPFIWIFLKAPVQGAQTSIYCSLSSELNDVSGKYFADMKEKEPSPAALNNADAKRLWAISEIWTRLNKPTL